MTRYLAILLLFFAAPVFATLPDYVNLKSQFKAFIESAQDKDFETQLKIWQTEVESALPKIYSELLSQNPDKTIEQNRRDKAQKWFPFMFAHADKIFSQFDAFDKNGWPMAQRLAENYPQVDFSNVRVIAMPSLMSFNGQVRTLKDGKIVAMFGMDFLQLVEENPKLIEGADLINNTSILVAHEFTHVLFGKILESSKEDDSNFGLWASLWNEGLAQIHSQMLVPGTDLTTVLMERNLAAKCTAPQATAWAELFLQDAAAASDTELEAASGKWFLMNNWKTLGVARAGYCLGYHSVLVAMREHSFMELINMKPRDAYLVVKKALMDVAASKQ
jgi:hypothetical protein